jgi:hypothetical protein
MIIKNNNTALTYGKDGRGDGGEESERRREIVTVCEITIKLTTLKISRVETMNSSIKLISPIIFDPNLRKFTSYEYFAFSSSPPLQSTLRQCDKFSTFTLAPAQQTLELSIS